MIAVRFSRTSSIARPHFHIHAAISTYMRRRRATRRTAHSTASTSQPAASPSNRSSGTSSTNTPSNPAAPTGTRSSGATKPTSATPNATPPCHTTHPSTRRPTTDVYLPELRRAPPKLRRSGDSRRCPARSERLCSKPHMHFVAEHIRQRHAHECTANRSLLTLAVTTPDSSAARSPRALVTSRCHTCRSKHMVVYLHHLATASCKASASDIITYNHHLIERIATFTAKLISYPN